MPIPARSRRALDHSAALVKQAETRQERQLSEPRAATIVEPRLRHPAEGKSVRELHRLIEEALVLLASDPEREASEEPAPAVTSPAVVTSKPSLGAPPGSEIRHRSTWSGRIIKTVIGLSVALLIGIVPLQHLLTPYSTEAFVNAPVSTLRAAVSGRLHSSDMVIGGHVATGDPLVTIQKRGETTGPLEIRSPASGKLWEILVQPGDDVLAGQEIARIVACAAASVTAAVSQSVYDSLSPGMPARFNFYGSSQFYPGTVANLFGHSTPTGNLAISPASIASDAYRVVVSVPGLGAIPDCAVGRRGEVTFGRSAR